MDKKKQPETAQSDDALFETLNKNKKRKKRRIVITVVCIVAVLLCGCGEKEPEETTVSGMVVSLEGTTLSLVSMEAGSIPSRGDRTDRQQNSEETT